MDAIQFLLEFFPGDDRSGSSQSIHRRPARRVRSLPFVEVTLPEVGRLLFRQSELLPFVDAAIEQRFQFGEIVREVERQFRQVLPVARLLLVHVLAGAFEAIDRLRALIDEIVDEDAEIVDVVQDVQSIVVVVHDLAQGLIEIGQDVEHVGRRILQVHLGHLTVLDDAIHLLPDLLDRTSVDAVGCAMLRDERQGADGQTDDGRKIERRRAHRRWIGPRAENTPA